MLYSSSSQGAPTSNYRQSCLENRPELLTAEIAKEVVETITDNGVEELIEGDTLLAEAGDEEVHMELDMTPTSAEGDIFEGGKLHKVQDKDEASTFCDGINDVEERKESGDGVQVDCKAQNEQEEESEQRIIQGGNQDESRTNWEENEEGGTLEKEEENMGESQGDKEEMQEGGNSDHDASSNDRSSSYMIVILPPGETSTNDTTQESSITSQGSEVDEDEDVVSADLGYPKTETPSVNTGSPGASPLRRAISGDIPDAGELAAYETVDQKKIIGISSMTSSEELSLELDEGIVGDEENNKEEEGDVFPKVSRSFKTSTPLRTDETQSPRETTFKYPLKLEDELKVPGKLEDELRLSSNSVETEVRNPHNKVAAYLQSLPPPSAQMAERIDKLCNEGGHEEKTVRQVEVLREDLLDRNLASDQDRSSHEEREEQKVDILREGLLDRSLDSDPAVSQASGSRTSRQSDLGSLTGRCV